MADPDLDFDALGARAEAMVTELAAISADRDRLVRLFLSPEHRRAADLTARWMAAAGMAVSEDALGTVRGRYPAAGEGLGGSDAVRRLLVGSHLDTVVDAGKYDGALGVVAGILAVEHIARAGRRLPFGIDVLAFGDEEGSRFPGSLSSSAATAGVFEDGLLAQTDRDGTSYAEALKRYGKNPSDIPAAAYPPGEALGYVEVHIEQGPVLEAEGEALGVVTAIVGQSRLRVVVSGEAGHAGTVPMRLRRDALAGAAELIGALEAIARAEGENGVVATVGRIAALPGATNVIPGEAGFTVDLRAPSDELRRRCVDAFVGAAGAIAARRALALAVEPFHEVATTRCDERLRGALADAVAGLGGRPVALASGAGHDGQSMAHLCPVAMLFVRCKAGISHHPAEFCSRPDMGRAVAALIRLFDRYRPDGAP